MVSAIPGPSPCADLNGDGGAVASDMATGCAFPVKENQVLVG
jgi:hypothetical protein